MLYGVCWHPKKAEGLICAQNWLKSKIISFAGDEDKEPEVIDGTEDPASYMIDIGIYKILHLYFRLIKIFYGLLVNKFIFSQR